MPFLPELIAGVRPNAVLRRMSEVLQGDLFSLFTDCICIELCAGDDKDLRVERLAAALWEQTCFLSHLTLALGGAPTKRGGERGRSLLVKARQDAYLQARLLRLEARCKRILNASPSGVTRAAFAFLLNEMQENITIWKESFE